MASSRVAVHGTRATYCNLACRCPECRQANSDYVGAWKRAKRRFGQPLPRDWREKLRELEAA